MARFADHAGRRNRIVGAGKPGRDESRALARGRLFFNGADNDDTKIGGFGRG
jgi:hypothetical protein